MNFDLFILSGLPFSGKTTFGKELSKNLNLEYIGYDEYWHVIKDKYGKDPSWDEMNIEIEKYIERFLLNNKKVIYDSLNDTYNNRQKFIDFAEKINKKALILYMDTSLEIIENRRLKNYSTKKRHDVSDNNFEEALNRFEIPKQNEPFIKIEPGNNINEIIKIIKSL